MEQNQLMDILFNYEQNPLYQRAQQMANGKSEQELQQIAENICREKGINFQQAMSQFQKISALLKK